MDISIDGKQHDPVTQYVNTIFREKANSGNVETEFVAVSSRCNIVEKCEIREKPPLFRLESVSNREPVRSSSSLAFSTVIIEAVRASDRLIAKLPGSTRADKAEARRIPGGRGRKNGRK